MFHSKNHSSNLILCRPILLALALRGAKDGKVGDHLLRVLRLAGAGLAGDQHRLILRVVHHLRVGAVAGSEQVRRHLL